MKCNVISFSLIVFCLLSSRIDAQAFEKNVSILSVGAGATSNVMMQGVPRIEHPGRNRPYLSPLRPQFTFKGEFAVSRYWGVGFTTGIDGRHYNAVPFANQNYDQVNFQMGAVTNFHFYQLIADKLNNPAKMHADKLDVYTGSSLGYMLSINMQPGYTNYQHNIFMDYHVGVRYFVTPHFSVYGELGYGQSIFNVGASFKIGGAKKEKAVKQF